MPTQPQLWLLDLRPLSLDSHAKGWHAAGLLTDDEWSAGARYAHTGVRLQFLAGRALLRHVLSLQAPTMLDSNLTGRTAADCFVIQLSGRHGKPALAVQEGVAQRHFNLSHSGYLVGCALASSSVGLDVETTARTLDILQIARLHFSKAEAAWVAAKPGADRARFTALWTLKEAYLKAVGMGLSVPIGRVSASDFRPRRCRMFSPDVPGDNAAAGAGWHCRWMQPLPDYWLAICQQQPFCKPRTNWVELLV